MKTLAECKRHGFGHFEPVAVAKCPLNGTIYIPLLHDLAETERIAIRSARCLSKTLQRCDITLGPSAMHGPRVMHENCLPLATTTSSHMLPARHWIRPMRLPSQRAHTARSICKIRCGSEIATCSPSCHVTRRCTLAALAALLLQPSLTALADSDREQVGNPRAQMEITQEYHSISACVLIQEEQASTLEDRASDSAAATIPRSSQERIAQPTPLPGTPAGTVPTSSGSQVLQYTVAPAGVGATTFWIKV